MVFPIFPPECRKVLGTLHGVCCTIGGRREAEPALPTPGCGSSLLPMPVCPSSTRNQSALLHLYLNFILPHTLTGAETRSSLLGCSTVTSKTLFYKDFDQRSRAHIIIMVCLVYFVLSADTCPWHNQQPSETGQS